jgi:TM2 domain-containing membrane protein YozV
MNQEKKRRKNPMLALALSAVFPGLGQIYNGWISKGVVLIIVNIVINFLLIEPLEKLIESRGSVPDNSTLIIVAGYTIAGLVLWLYAIIDAKKTAERMNRDNMD